MYHVEPTVVLISTTVIKNTPLFSQSGLLSMICKGCYAVFVVLSLQDLGLFSISQLKVQKHHSDWFGMSKHLTVKVKCSSSYFNNPVKTQKSNAHCH